MLVKNPKDIKSIIAEDGSIVKEILHPKTDPIKDHSITEAVVKPGQTTKRHILENQETYLILEGKGIMRINEEQREVGKGDAIYIPSGSIQSIKNTGETDLKFYCIVQPEWKAEKDKALE